MSTPAQNIYIIGAQSTGKSTLVHTLEAHFHQTNSSLLSSPTVIREVARSVLRDHHYKADDIRSSAARALELQRLILAAQAQAEREVTCSSAPCWLISDRSAVDPIAYAWQYAGPDAARALMASTEWREMRDRMTGALVVVCEAGVNWLTDDGVRLMPTRREEWIKTHEVFCQVLEEAGLEYIILPRSVESTEDRLAFVLQNFKTPTAVIS